MAGSGTAPEHLTFTVGFFISRAPPDALVVVDNGVSMAGFTDRVRADLGRLLDMLDRGNEGRWANHGIAVTSTALAPDPACPNGVQGGEDGRFVPVDGRRPRAVNRDTANGRWALEENLAVGTCHRAAAQPLEAALRALTPPLSTTLDDPRHPEPNDGNRGLLTTSASRLLVLVTSRDDSSPLPVTEYATRLAEAGVDEVLVIAGAPTTGCSRGPASALPADRLGAFVAAFPGSQFASICELPLRIATLPPPFEERCFGCAPDTNLDGRVDDADLQVLVNGVARLAAAGEWAVDEETHALCLGEAAELYWGDNTVSLVWP